MSNRRGSVKEQWEKWLDPNDQKQCEWVLSFLLKREVITLTQSKNDFLLVALFDSVPSVDSDKFQLLIKDIKAAWNQKKIRDQNNGRKGYSFVMQTDVQKKLDQLAKANGVALNRTLENLIKDTAGFNAQLQSNYKAEVEKLKLENKMKAEKLGLSLKKQKNKNEIAVKKLKKEIEIQYTMIEELFSKVFTKDLVLEEKKLTDQVLTEEQEQLVLGFVQNNLDQLKKVIKQETDKIGSLEFLLT